MTARSRRRSRSRSGTDTGRRRATPGHVDARRLELVGRAQHRHPVARRPRDGPGPDSSAISLPSPGMMATGARLPKWLRKVRW